TSEGADRLLALGALAVCLPFAAAVSFRVAAAVGLGVAIAVGGVMDVSEPSLVLLTLALGLGATSPVAIA
nr:hypothetical protein [Tanacetum cinerariifolium]